MSEKFKDYCSSNITPQMTLLEKLNKIIKFLKENPEINLIVNSQNMFYCSDNFSDGELTYDLSHLSNLSGETVKVGNIVFFKNAVLALITSLYSGTFTIAEPVKFKGEKGDTGSQGIQGIQGERGLQGIQGIQGIAGPQGPQGPEGPEGPQGPQGLDGRDLYIHHVYFILNGNSQHVKFISHKSTAFDSTEDITSFANYTSGVFDIPIYYDSEIYTGYYFSSLSGTSGQIVINGMESDGSWIQQTLTFTNFNDQVQKI